MTIDSAQLLDSLRRDGHLRCSDARIVPLTGGVSSDIYLVEDGAAKFVVKRALPKLKVKDDWFADVRRNATEQAYLEYVDRAMPGVVPRVYFANRDLGYLCMEFLGNGFANWKHLMLSGDCRIEHAKLGGKVLGQIHHRTTSDSTLYSQFNDIENFHRLRIEPYLLTTGTRHPKLRDVFFAEARRIEATREVLVHGDFSPKNILVSDERFVLLDAEVAWYGDAVFDVAFVLTHLFLKALYHAGNDRGIDRMIAGLWHEYVVARPGCNVQSLEQRVVPLLLMFLLARIDGKSPVEYLGVQRQQVVRDFVYKHLLLPPQDLATTTDAWFAELRTAPSRREQ